MKKLLAILLCSGAIAGAPMDGIWDCTFSAPGYASDSGVLAVNGFENTYIVTIPAVVANQRRYGYAVITVSGGSLSGKNSNGGDVDGVWDGANGITGRQRVKYSNFFGSFFVTENVACTRIL